MQNKRRRLVFTALDIHSLYRDLYECVQNQTASRTELNIFQELHHSMFSERDRLIEFRYRQMFGDTKPAHMCYSHSE
ncbi:hypothetical protein [Deinococcus misasensis]|uniref:hypothetical protein n=1 Tax=Deinococcus misasensis TaxID=392413 RepID=UPI0012F8C92D|nr:hypothetical protein [Deinococcus misasensis]